MGISVGDVIAIGRHRVVCEEDLYFVTFIGETTVEDTWELDKIIRHYAKQGYLLCLGDITHAASMSHEARKLTAQLSRDLNCPGATALYGGSAVTRVLASLVLKAMTLIVRDMRLYSLFKTEAEARTWLAEQRPLLRAQRDGHRAASG